MKRLNQSGSHIVALLLGVLVIGIISFAGYVVMQRQHAATTTTSTASTVPASTTTKAPEAISNNAELNQAAKSLDDSSSQLDSGLNDDALNADLNDML